MNRWVHTKDNLDLFSAGNPIPVATVRIEHKTKFNEGKRKFGRLPKLMQRYKRYTVTISSTGQEQTFHTALKSIKFAENSIQENVDV